MFTIKYKILYTSYYYFVLIIYSKYLGTYVCHQIFEIISTNTNSARNRQLVDSALDNK